MKKPGWGWRGGLERVGVDAGSPQVRTEKGWVKGMDRVREAGEPRVERGGGGGADLVED